MRPLAYSLLLVTAASAPALLACVPTESPLPELGSARVMGSLEENACGSAAVPALDPIEYTVTFGGADQVVEWRRPGSPHIVGQVRRDGEWRFTTQTTIPVYEPDPITGAPGCSMIQTETTTFESMGTPPPVDYDAGTQGDAGLPGDAAPQGDATVQHDAGPQEGQWRLPESFEGTGTVTFAPAPGSNCSRSLATFGGPFLALPCDVNYHLEGERD